MTDTPLFAVCTFKRVFDTNPVQEVVTLGQLTAALRRFEIKQSLQLRMDRETERVQRALACVLAGEHSTARYVDRIGKAFRDSKAAGIDPIGAAQVAAHRLEGDLKKHAKKDLRLWSPALYRTDAIKRGTDGVSHVSCLVLDYDEHPSIADATAPFMSYFHIVHSTWSHRPDKPKFRVVLPLSAPVRAEDWEKVWAFANERADGKIDPALKSPASTFALPATPSADFVRVAYVQPGPLFDPVAEGLVSRTERLLLSPLVLDEGGFVHDDPEHLYIEDRPEEAIYFVDDPLEALEIWSNPGPTYEAKSLPAQSHTPVDEVGPTELANRDIGELIKVGIEVSSVVADGTAEDSSDPDGDEDDPQLHLAFASALERLFVLHRAGALDEREFRLAKTKVLRRDPVKVTATKKSSRSRRICVDFDGVLHRYSSGWSGATVVEDPPVPGALAFLREAVNRFQVAIHSVRSAQEGGIDAIKSWLSRFGLEPEVIGRISFPRDKPPAAIYLDDRAWTFNGTFPSLDDLAQFEPWHKRTNRAIHAALPGHPAPREPGQKAG